MRSSIKGRLIAGFSIIALIMLTSTSIIFYGLISNDTLMDRTAGDLQLDSLVVDAIASVEGDTDALIPLIEDLVGNHQKQLASDMDELEKSNSQMKSVIVISAIAGVLIIVLIVFYVVKSIMKPLSTLNERIELVCIGDLNSEVKVSGNDEIAEATQNLSRMVANLKVVISSVSNIAEKLGEASSQIKKSQKKYLLLWRRCLPAYNKTLVIHRRVKTFL
jgi:methyl-accepting chemotaxis protein